MADTPQEPAEQKVPFSALQLHPSIQESIGWMGFEFTTPVQAKAIPAALEGKDILACAQTGTGKTAAYILPVLSAIAQSPEKKGIQCLVLAPTRELALQIDQQIQGLGYSAGVTSIPVYGGNDGGKTFDTQRKALTEGAPIVVATPGRLLMHMKMKYVDLSKLNYFILDEADKMLDMGFVDDIRTIEQELPTLRQTLLFSATMPEKIRKLARYIMREPMEINIAISKPAEKIDQQLYLVKQEDKEALLDHLLSTEEIESMILFTSRKSSVSTIVRMIKAKGREAVGVQSGLEQSEREDAVRKFKNGEVKLLVATDILSRGIDVEGVSHVINFDIPNDPEDYIHRIGRTARAEKTGTAITFVTDDQREQRRVLKIERLMEREIPKLELPESIGKSPAFAPQTNKNRRNRNPNRTGGKRPTGQQGN